jgi:Uma2 family endonuclease
MVAQPKESTRMTEAEYLAFERASDTKHEYIDGHVYAMTGGSPAHSLISSYTGNSLMNQLQGQPCAVYNSDVKIKANRDYVYADVSVVCGEPQYKDKDILLNPIVVIEVLSPSTEQYDRGRKFHQYRQLESLQEYLLIAQNSPHIERYLRQSDGTWLYADAIGLDTSLELPSIGCTLALADVYEKVTFEAEDAAGQ